MDLILMVGTIAAILILGLVAWCVWQLIADKRFERENQPRIIAERESDSSNDQPGKNPDIALNINKLRGIDRMLVEAGIAMSSGAFIAVLAIGALILFAFGLLSSGLLAAVICPAAMLVITKLAIGRKTKKRTELFEKQLTQAEMQIAENLRSGLSVARSLRTVTEQTKDPLKRQFEAVYNEITYSSTTLPQALSNMAARTANKDVELLATVIKVQDETGSDLSDSLDFLSDTLAKRTEMRNSVKVELSQMKMTIKIVAAMPLVILALVWNFYTGFAEFYQSPLGMVILIACAAIELIALWILGRMSDVKFD